MKKKTVYFENEEKDEFSKAKIQPKVIDSGYKYLPKSKTEKIFGAILYRAVGTPIAYFYVKLRFARKIIGGEKIKPYKKSGFFLYGNHTHAIFDALNPGTLVFFKKAYTIASAENLAIKGIGRFVKYLGAIPIPKTTGAYRNFKKAIEEKIDGGNCIVIYPEAHIWPYHTGIRSFSETPFYFPVSLNTPVFCFTNTYHKRAFFGTKVITYIDGPFFPDPELDKKESAKDLRDRVYAAMKERARTSTLTRVEYVKREDTE